MWLIGNGKDVSVVNDPWIGKIPIARWPTYVNVDSQITGMKVCDLIFWGI